MLRFNSLLWGCLLLIVAAQSNAQPAATTKKGKTFASNKSGLDMRGAYMLTRQVANNGIKDSLMEARQLKIFTDNYLLYVHPGADDSLAVYGVGKYTVADGKVIEDIFYTSAEGPVTSRFELAINHTGNGYAQVIQFAPGQDNISWKLTEDYQRVDQKMVSPLDGAWKQTKVVSVAADGTTETIEAPTQFKFFYRGNFAWVSTVKDAGSNKPVSFYGYGNFKMNGNGELIENNTSSSFKAMLVNKPVTVRIRMLDKDHFEQTIDWEGSKQMEVYERMQ
jgi:hypothetical protein